MLLITTKTIERNKKMATLSEWTEFAENSRFKDIPIKSFAAKDEWVDNFMSRFHSKIRINQLRNFFGEIQTIKNNPTIWQDSELVELKNKLAMVEMNLAYDYGRNVITKDFFETITASLKKIEDEKDFKQFVVFIQSLIAYHKFHSNR